MDSVDMSRFHHRLVPLLGPTTYPANLLAHSTRGRLGLHLNPERNTFSEEHGLLQDWRGLAEYLGFSPLEVDNIALAQDKTTALLGQWSINPEATIRELLMALYHMERFDILMDDRISEMFKRNAQDYLEQQERSRRDAERKGPVQVSEVESSGMTVDEFQNITINEDGQPEYFDAFICYTGSDFPFVQQMLEKLERKHGVKLCIPERDIVVGGAEYSIIAKLIKERCRKMIIVLSPDYTKSEACDFQTKFAFSLSPGAKKKILIPIMYKRCQIPDILTYICLLDFEKADVIDWFWERLAKSLKKDPVYVPISSLYTAPADLEHFQESPTMERRQVNHSSTTSCLRINQRSDLMDISDRWSMSEDSPYSSNADLTMSAPQMPQLSSDDHFSAPVSQQNQETQESHSTCLESTSSGVRAIFTKNKKSESAWAATNQPTNKKSLFHK